MKDNLPRGIMKVAVLSGSHEAGDKVRSAGLGVNHYLTKPDSVETHVDLLRSLERSLAEGGT